MNYILRIPTTRARLVAFAFLAFSTLAAAMWLAFVEDAGAQGDATVIVGRLEGSIDPASARIVSGWLEVVEARGASLFVLELDTPGGSLDSMRDVTGDLLESSVPVAVLVTPAGARAASAGMFVTAAGHFSAMAQGTTIGAASPVKSDGSDLSETIKAKASQDAAALLRGIATQRNRGPEAISALESAIFEAKSYSAQEALDIGIIDAISANVADLLTQIDGRTVTVDGGEVTLISGEAVIEHVEPSSVQRFRGWLANPQLIFIMLAVGGILLLVELVTPGGWIPGATGVTLLALAIIGLVDMPVNWIGLALIGVGLGLIFYELQAPGWGVFGAAGGVAFILGGFLLFGDAGAPGLPAPSVEVGWGVLGAAAAFIALSVFGLFHFSRKAKNLYFPSKMSQLVGQTGLVKSDLSPRGVVQVYGELWTAESESGEMVHAGERVVVADLDGVILKVFKESSL